MPTVTLELERLHTIEVAVERVPLTGRGAVLAGLAAFWELEEAAGLRSDARGANHLNESNGVGSAPGRVGSSASFEEAAGAWLSCPSTPDLAGSGDWTICGWINPTGSERRAVVAKWDPEFEYLVRIGLTSFELIVFSGAANVVLTGPKPPNGAWTFFTVWRDAAAGTIGLELNASGIIASAAAPGAILATGQALQIGRRSSQQGFTGLIDQVGIWRRVLEAEDRAFLYKGGLGRRYDELLGLEMALALEPLHRIEMELAFT